MKTENIEKMLAAGNAQIVGQVNDNRIDDLQWIINDMINRQTLHVSVYDALGWGEKYGIQTGEEG